MNTTRLKKQLKIDEGYSTRVYEDSLGYKTVGIGHLIKEGDPQWLRDLPVGDSITDEDVQDLFEKDLAIAMADTKIIFEPVWDILPSGAKEVFVNMVFNLGRTRFMGFKKTIHAAYQLDWETVSKEMLDSRWAAQVGVRATRLSKRILSLNSDLPCH